MKDLICLIMVWTLPLFNAVESSRELRIVLLGKTGTGKSSSGNIILGKDAFKVVQSFQSVTSVSEMERGEVHGREITVVDTPGVFDTTKTVAEVRTEIEKCVNYSLPGPHVFLLVIRADVRFTEEERNTVKWIQKNFGKRAAQFTMVLFTHRNGMKEVSLKDIKANEDLKKLIDSCGGKYHNLNIGEDTDKTQVKKLLRKIDALVYANEEEYYTNKMYQEAQRKRDEESKKKQEKKKEEQSVLSTLYSYLVDFLKCNPLYCPFGPGKSEKSDSASSDDLKMDDKYEVKLASIVKVVQMLKERLEKVEGEKEEETWREEL